MFKTSLLCAALGTALLAAAPAQAYTIDGVVANGNLVDTSFSSPTMLSLDVGLLNTSSLSVSLHFDAGDAAVLPFNALVKNFIGLGFETITLTLAGSQFNLPLGTAGASFGSVALVSGNADAVSIRFTGPEYFEATLGDWYLNGAGSDFGIVATTGPVLLTIAAAVPEPAGYALFVAGLGLVGCVLRRRHPG